MSRRRALTLLLFSAFAGFGTGCRNAPGKPGPSAEAARPEQVLDFATLYKGNCAGCHGEQGVHGASVSLANATYLTFAGVPTLERITANGVPHTSMPGFSKRAGGTLTDAQISALAKGMIHVWGSSNAALGQTPPPYSSSLAGNRSNGERTFQATCARCHGADGMGVRTSAFHTGPLMDPTYLALVSDQSLRSTIVSGCPGDGMPDWRGNAVGPDAHALTDGEITDIVAWMGSHRDANPGQPYPQHP